MKRLALFAFLLIATISFGQSDSAGRKLSEIIQLHGYVRNMQTFVMADLNYISQNNLIHNRLNFRIYPSSYTTVGLEVRNRVFTGDQVNNIPFYSSLVNTDPGIVDLSWAWLDEPGIVAVSKIDRLWFRWSNQKWDVTLGRQRINWGINAFWNSNDLFNTFNLADFDYEERPGSDAIRVQRYFGRQRSIDVAIVPSMHDSTWVGSAMYKFNYKTYDIQFLTGWWNEDLAIGTGWAGNVKTAGFKGEVTWFQSRKNLDQLNQGSLSASVSADYVFPGSLYVMGGMLFSSSGTDSLFNFSALATGLGGVAPPSAKNLMPTKYSTMLSVSKPLTPLISGSLVGLYSPGANLLFVMPSLSAAVATSWDFSVFAQSTFLDNGKNFRNYGTSVFARLKWGF